MFTKDAIGDYQKKKKKKRRYNWENIFCVLLLFFFFFFLDFKFTIRLFRCKIFVGKYFHFTVFGNVHENTV